MEYSDGQTDATEYLKSGGQIFASKEPYPRVAEVYDSMPLEIEETKKMDYRVSLSDVVTVNASNAVFDGYVIRATPNGVTVSNMVTVNKALSNYHDVIVALNKQISDQLQEIAALKAENESLRAKMKEYFDVALGNGEEIIRLEGIIQRLQAERDELKATFVKDGGANILKTHRF